MVAARNPAESSSSPGLRLKRVSSGKCKNCSCNFGDRRPPLSNAKHTEKKLQLMLEESSLFICGSSVMLVDSSVRDASTMSWLLVGPATSPVDSGVPDASTMPWLLKLCLPGKPH
ncbi:hypothetical protein TNCV_51321 [Trichonephila clavipes]|nr:hypothetical protein TNCV_51321 [Trichonephila clavipes]